MGLVALCPQPRWRFTSSLDHSICHLGAKNLSPFRKNSPPGIQVKNSRTQGWVQVFGWSFELTWFSQGHQLFELERSYEQVWPNPRDDFLSPPNIPVELDLQGIQDCIVGQGDICKEKFKKHSVDQPCLHDKCNPFPRVHRICQPGWARIG